MFPKGFFPLADTGRRVGGLQADQGSSFQAMRQKLEDTIAIVGRDPAVASVSGFTGAGSGGGAGTTNTATVFLSLKPLGQPDDLQTVPGRLARAPSGHPGARLLRQAVQTVQ